MSWWIHSSLRWGTGESGRACSGDGRSFFWLFDLPSLPSSLPPFFSARGLPGGLFGPPGRAKGFQPRSTFRFWGVRVIPAMFSPRAQKRRAQRPGGSFWGPRGGERKFGGALGDPKIDKKRLKFTRVPNWPRRLPQEAPEGPQGSPKVAKRYRKRGPGEDQKELPEPTAATCPPARWRLRALALWIVSSK